MYSRPGGTAGPPSSVLGTTAGPPRRIKRLVQQWTCAAERAVSRFWRNDRASPAQDAKNAQQNTAHEKLENGTAERSCPAGKSPRNYLGNAVKKSSLGKDHRPVIQRFDAHGQTYAPQCISWPDVCQMDFLEKYRSHGPPLPKRRFFG